MCRQERCTKEKNWHSVESVSSIGNETRTRRVSKEDGEGEQQQFWLRCRRDPQKIISFERYLSPIDPSFSIDINCSPFSLCLLISSGTGDKRIVIQRVDANVTSLNNGDVFILDAGKKIYVWCGSKSNAREKRKGLHLANLVRTVDGGMRGRGCLADETGD